MFFEAVAHDTHTENGLHFSRGIALRLEKVCCFGKCTDFFQIETTTTRRDWGDRLNPLLKKS
jgi:hypothetical protein